VYHHVRERVKCCQMKFRNGVECIWYVDEASSSSHACKTSFWLRNHVRNHVWDYGGVWCGTHGSLVKVLFLFFFLVFFLLFFPVSEVLICCSDRRELNSVGWFMMCTGMQSVEMFWLQKKRMKISTDSGTNLALIGSLFLVCERSEVGALCTFVNWAKHFNVAPYCKHDL
jgi:hypothetical protein